MPIDREYLAAHYQELATDSLTDLHQEGTLTEEAYPILEDELVKRGITPAPRPQFRTAGKVEPFEAQIRQWRKVVLTPALLLPLFSYLVALVLSEIQWGDQLHWVIETPFHQFGWADFLNLAAYYPPLVLIYDWPFFIYSIIVTKTIRKYSPNHRTIQYKCGFGYTFFLIPYLIGYALDAGTMASEYYYHGDGGQGVGIVMGLISFAALPLALLGWITGTLIMKFLDWRAR